MLIHTVGNDTRIDYTPSPRYAGADAFSVRLLPGDATIRVNATVTPVTQWCFAAAATCLRTGACASCGHISSVAGTRSLPAA